MPKFVELNPREIVLGRGRAAMQRREAYRETVRKQRAGRIELEAGDEPERVKQDLRRASKEVGIRIRSSWEDDTQRALLWKRTGL